MADGLQVLGGAPSSTVWNKVARRVVIDCTVATRPSAPLVGMTIYETDTFIQRRWDGSRWIAFPMGLLDTHAITGVASNSGTSLTPIGNSGCTFNAYAGQKYSFEFGCTFASSQTPGYMSFIAQRDDGSGYVNADSQRDVPCNNALIGHHFQFRCLIGYSSDVANAKVRMTVTSPAGTWTIPAGTDSSIIHLGDFV